MINSQQQYQQHIIDGKPVTIRPISPDDLELEKAFIDRLSPTTKHFRFLGGVRQVPTHLLKEFCNVDFDHTAAFIATTYESGEEREIGVVRYAQDEHDDDNVREMAITIADEWQNKGLDTWLAQQLFDFAKDHGIRELYSIELSDNNHMRALADSLGMSASHDPDDAHQVIYSLTL